MRHGQERVKKNTYTLDGSPLLLRYADHMCTRGNRPVLAVLKVGAINTKQPCDSGRVLFYHLHQRRVLRTELLNQRLDQSWVLNHKVAQLLDLRIVLQCGEIELGTRGGCPATACSTNLGLLLLLLLCKL